MTIAKIPPNEQTVKAGEVKDEIRMTGSARKTREVQKKKRVAQKKEKSYPKAGKTCKRARSNRKGRWSILCQRSFQ
jgi:Flp pilus assembly secretin CpaC